MTDRGETDAAEAIIRPREATLAEAADLARLMGLLGYPTSAEAMASRLKTITADPARRTVAAEVAGAVRGMVGLRRELIYDADGPFVHLMSMVVDDGWQGRGIGAALAGEAERWAREQGARAIMLTSGKHRGAAHRFYERLGYEATGLRFVKRLEP